MINLIYKDDKIQYEINEKNIIKEGFKVDPKIIALAKTNDELTQLYLETGMLLDSEKEKADKLSIELRKLEKEFLDQKKLIADQNNIIQQQIVDINNQKEIQDSLILKTKSKYTAFRVL